RTKLYPRRRPPWYLSIRTQPFHARLGKEVRSPTPRPNDAKRITHTSRSRTSSRSRPRSGTYQPIVGRSTKTKRESDRPDSSDHSANSHVCGASTDIGQGCPHLP